MYLKLHARSLLVFWDELSLDERYTFPTQLLSKRTYWKGHISQCSVTFPIAFPNVYKPSLTKKITKKMALPIHFHNQDSYGNMCRLCSVLHAVQYLKWLCIVLATSILIAYILERDQGYQVVQCILHWCYVHFLALLYSLY